MPPCRGGRGAESVCVVMGMSTSISVCLGRMSSEHTRSNIGLL